MTDPTDLAQNRSSKRERRRLDSWLLVEVGLLSGVGDVFRPAPGRLFAVPPTATFEEFAHSIDVAFSRWDHSHLHAFRFADGTEVGYPDDEAGDPDDFIDHDVAVTELVKPDDEFRYVFDFGDNWQHRCRVIGTNTDRPADSVRAPVMIGTWGESPEQYPDQDDDD